MVARALLQRVEREAASAFGPTCRHELRLLVETLETGEVPSADAFVPVREAASRLAAEGVAPADVVGATLDRAIAGWQALLGAARGESQRAEAGAAAGLVLEYARAVAVAASVAYLDESTRVGAAAHAAEWALVDAFLAGRPTAEAAARAGRHLAAAYGVLLLDGVVRREHLRDFEAAIAALGDGQALWRLTAGGANVLVPVPATGAASWLAEADALVARLASAGGSAPLVATVAWGAGAEGVARAGDDAVQVLRLVTGLGRPPGLYRLDDVLLEAALSGTAPGPAARLAAILAPLDGGGPELVTTLETYLGLDADRRRTAAALHIHPNTLDYRLRRIGELTGRSPATARGLQVLGAALTLRRVTKSVSTRYS
jgi:hypothetical protein